MCSWQAQHKGRAQKTQYGVGIIHMQKLLLVEAWNLVPFIPKMRLYTEVLADHWS
jgi:hypothetical protein